MSDTCPSPRYARLVRTEGGLTASDPTGWVPSVWDWLDWRQTTARLRSLAERAQVAALVALRDATGLGVLELAAEAVRRWPAATDAARQAASMQDAAPDLLSIDLTEAALVRSQVDASTAWACALERWTHAADTLRAAAGLPPLTGATGPSAGRGGVGGLLLVGGLVWWLSRRDDPEAT